MLFHSRSNIAKEEASFEKEEADSEKEKVASPKDAAMMALMKDLREELQVCREERRLCREEIVELKRAVGMGGGVNNSVNDATPSMGTVQPAEHYGLDAWTDKAVEQESGAAQQESHGLTRDSPWTRII